MCVSNVKQTITTAEIKPQVTNINKEIKTEHQKVIEKTELTVKDEALINNKKASIAEKEVIDFVDKNYGSDTKNNDKYYDRTTLLASFVLSTAKASPVVVAPLRLFSNSIFIDSMTTNVNKSFKDKEYLNLTTSSLNSARGCWWSYLSGVSLAKSSYEFANSKELLSTKADAFVSKQFATAANITGKLSLPFSGVGVVLSGADLTRESLKLNERSKMLKEVEKLRADPSNKNKETLNKAEVKLKEDIKVLKVNTAIKGASFALSTISTGALVTAIKKPPLSKKALAISMTTSIASVATTLYSDQGYRKATSDFISDSYEKIVNFIKEKK